MNRGTLPRLLLLGAIWGSSFLWIKFALRGLGAVDIAFGRATLGALFLGGTIALRRIPLPRTPIVWLHLVVIGLFGTAIPFVLFGIGEGTVDSGIAGLANATTPLWTVLIGFAARQERSMHRNRAIGLLLGIAGTVLIFAPWDTGALPLGGTLACVAAAMSYGVTFVYAGRFIRPRGLSPLVLALGQTGAAALLLAPIVPFTGEKFDLAPMVVVAMAILGALGTGLAFMLNFRILADEGPTVASTVTFLMPVVAVALGAAVLGERPGIRVLAGMVVVLAGVAIAQRSGSRQPARPAAALPEQPAGVPPD